MKRVSKFINLEKFLSSQDKQYLDLSFSEIENIIGENLCPSAYKYKPYWHTSKTHTLPNLILDCGYKIIETNLIDKIIKLQRII